MIHKEHVRALLHLHSCPGSLGQNLSWLSWTKAEPPLHLTCVLGPLRSCSAARGCLSYSSASASLSSPSPAAAAAAAALAAAAAAAAAAASFCFCCFALMDLQMRAIHTPTRKTRRCLISMLLLGPAQQSTQARLLPGYQLLGSSSRNRRRGIQSTDNVTRGTSYLSSSCGLSCCRKPSCCPYCCTNSTSSSDTASSSSSSCSAAASGSGSATEMWRCLWGLPVACRCAEEERRQAASHTGCSVCCCCNTSPHLVGFASTLLLALLAAAAGISGLLQLALFRHL